MLVLHKKSSGQGVMHHALCQSASPWINLSYPISSVLTVHKMRASAIQKIELLQGLFMRLPATKTYREKTAKNLSKKYDYKVMNLKKEKITKMNFIFLFTTKKKTRLNNNRLQTDGIPPNPHTLQPVSFYRGGI